MVTEFSWKTNNKQTELLAIASPDSSLMELTLDLLLIVGEVVTE
jgi:hypothetical protein